MEALRPPKNTQAICGFDTGSDDTSCRKGPYKKGSLLKMTVTPTRTFLIESIVMSETQRQRASVVRIGAEGGAILGDEISADCLILGGSLRAEKNKPLNIDVRLKEVQDRVMFCVMGRDCLSGELS